MPQPGMLFAPPLTLDPFAGQGSGIDTTRNPLIAGLETGPDALARQQRELELRLAEQHGLQAGVPQSVNPDQAIEDQAYVQGQSVQDILAQNQQQSVLPPAPALPQQQAPAQPQRPATARLKSGSTRWQQGLPSSVMNTFRKDTAKVETKKKEAINAQLESVIKVRKSIEAQLVTNQARQSTDWAMLEGADQTKAEAVRGYVTKLHAEEAELVEAEDIDAGRLTGNMSTFQKVISVISSALLGFAGKPMAGAKFIQGLIDRDIALQESAYSKKAAGVERTRKDMYSAIADRYGERDAKLRMMSIRQGQMANHLQEILAVGNLGEKEAGYQEMLVNLLQTSAATKVQIHKMEHPAQSGVSSFQEVPLAAKTAKTGQDTGTTFSPTEQALKARFGNTAQGKKMWATVVEDRASNSVMFGHLDDLRNQLAKTGGDPELEKWTNTEAKFYTQKAKALAMVYRKLYGDRGPATEKDIELFDFAERGNWNALVDYIKGQATGGKPGRQIITERLNELTDAVQRGWDLKLKGYLSDVAGRSQPAVDRSARETIGIKRSAYKSKYERRPPGGGAI